MKKILSIVLSAVILLGSFSAAYASSNFGELVSLGICENTFGLDEKITRAEFSYSVSKLMGSKTIKPKDTRFSDVSAENIYSGYIDFLAVNAVIDNESGISFNPNGNVTSDMASKMLTVALGYAKLCQYMGGYPAGYSSVAVSIGLFDKVSIKDGSALSKREAYSLLENALKTEIAAATNNVNDTWDPSLKSGKTPLSDKFGLSVYAGVIEKANLGEKTVRFCVEKNVYDENPYYANNGEKLNLSASGTVDIAGFEHVPSTIWVDADNKVIYIESQKDVNFSYRVIDSVNGERDENEAFTPSSISEISFLDDEEIYDVSDNLEIYYNGEKQSSPVCLLNKISKVVISDNEIVCIESWDFKEGGIVTEVKEEAIYYKSVSGLTLKLNDVNSFKNIRVIIGGASASLKEIKTGSVLDWWESENDLVIAVNERTVVDEFVNYSKNGITIGNGLYYTDEAYFSTDGKKFSLNSDYVSLLGETVKAYFAPNGKVKYIETYSKSVTSGETYVLVTGVEPVVMSEKEATLEVWTIAEVPEKKYFTLNEKTLYLDGANLETLKRIDKTKVTSSDDVSQNIYIITQNQKGIITEIKPAGKLLGFGGIYSTPSMFTDSEAYISAEGKSLYFSNVPVTVIYMLDDELKVSQVSFEKQLRGKRIGTSAKMAFLADSEDSQPDVVLLWGNDVSALGARVMQYGIFTDKVQVADVNGNKMYEVEIITRTGKNKYVVTEKTAEKLSKRSFVTFYSDLMFSNDDIFISGTPLSLEGAPSGWETSQTAQGLKKATVVRVDDKMLVTDKRDELGNVTGVEVFMAHPSQNFFLEYDSESINNPFKLISSSEITKGDTVYFNNISDGLRGVIVVR